MRLSQSKTFGSHGNPIGARIDLREEKTSLRRGVVAVRVAPVLTSLAFTVALGTTNPVASLMLPVSALLVPLCAGKVFALIAINIKRIARSIVVRIRINNELLRWGKKSQGVR